MSADDLTAKFTDTFQKGLATCTNNLNEKIKVLADNFNKHVEDQIGIVSQRCLGWFNNLKTFIDNNATEITKNANGVKRNVDDIAALRAENVELRKMIVDLQADSEYKTDHAFRLQLVLYNYPEKLPESEGVEDCFALVRQFMRDRLGIAEATILQMPIRDTHRLGKWNRDKIRPIVIAFTVQPHRDFVMRQAKNLRGTNFSLQPHLSAKQIAVKKALLAKRRVIKDANKDTLAFIGYRSYKPVLLVKVAGELTEYKDTMDPRSLQLSDNITVDT